MKDIGGKGKEEVIRESTGEKRGGVVLSLEECEHSRSQGGEEPEKGLEKEQCSKGLLERVVPRGEG